jgi:hypothetical protein
MEVAALCPPSLGERIIVPRENGFDYDAAIRHMMYCRPPGPHVSPYFGYINLLPFSLSNKKTL